MNDIDEEYKNYACVKKLSEQYKKNFICIVENYAGDLNNKIIIDGSVYTIHNFNNHCLDIYKIISEVLLDPQRAYENAGLTDKELYILDLAVLFHDISMSQDITTERDNHSLNSAKHIQNLFDNRESAFFKNCNLTQNEIKALKAIIVAHSDVKDCSVPPEERGLNSSKLNNNMAAKSGKIRGTLLAGILRLADELDITDDRLGNNNIEENLRKAKNKFLELEIKQKSDHNSQIQYEFNKYKKYVESLEHWEKLHLFSEVRRKNQDDVIHLITNDEYLEQMISEGNTAAAIGRQIAKVYEKIKSEWEKIKQKVLEESPQKLDVKSFFPIIDIEIECAVECVRIEVDKQINNVSKVKESYDLDEDKKLDDNMQVSHKDSMQGVALLDQSFSDKVTKEIKKRHLLKVGHFILNGKFCARDWIDTKEVIETRTILNDIVGRYIENICKTCDLKHSFVILGLDLEGALLASRVGMGMKMPFSYIIPVKDQDSASRKEQEIILKDCDKIILMTDAIVTYDTIKKALEGLEKSNVITKELLIKKIEKIYTIFYRDSNMGNSDDVEQFKEKTYCINMDFPIELFPKEHCNYFKHGECLALNGRIQIK